MSFRGKGILSISEKWNGRSKHCKYTQEHTQEEVAKVVHFWCCSTHSFVSLKCLIAVYKLIPVYLSMREGRKQKSMVAYVLQLAQQLFLLPVK